MEDKDACLLIIRARGEFFFGGIVEVMWSSTSRLSRKCGGNGKVSHLRRFQTRFSNIDCSNRDWGGLSDY